jgi:hypothetical protein
MGFVCILKVEQSIICNDLSYGHEDGLYEIMPMRDGKTFSELFGTTHDLRGNLSLQTALEIAEATLTLSINELRDLANEFFQIRG